MATSFQQKKGKTDSDEVVEFLSRPEAYPHEPAEVEKVETHSAWVFLTETRVYKVKKPVDLGFLNFSTLERRRRDCEREVRLNRRLCRGLYLGVSQITREENGSLCLEGRGRVIEVAVRMKRLDPRFFLDRLLEEGKVGPREMRRVARKLERFYREGRSDAKVAVWGRISRLKVSTDENFRQVQPFLGKTLSGAACRAVRHYTLSFYRHAASLLRQRVVQRRIRDCHGDLHLEHIHLTPRAVQIYDCIEFNDRFRFVDVANDAAFLAMDLDHHGRHDLSAYFMHRLADDLEDPGILKLADFYKCYRAFVRGKVESMQMETAGAPSVHRKAAQAYFRLALRYAVLGSKPVVVIVMGRVASGKSTLASALAGALGAKVLSSDQMRKQRAGLPAERRPGPEVRRHLYGEAMTRRTYQALRTEAWRRFQQGHVSILDATFSRAAQRNELVRRLEAGGVPYCFVEVTASGPERRQRLQERGARKGVISDARLEEMRRLDAAYQPPREISSPHRLRVRAEGDQALDRLLRAMVRWRIKRPAAEKRATR